MKREDLDSYKRIGRSTTAAMYLRKSRDEQGMTLEETLYKHRDALTAYADRYGFTVPEGAIFQEVVSGESLFARPQMLRLLEQVTAGQYEAVLCMEMSRLGRGGMYDQGFILDSFKQSETLIVTPDRIYDMSKEMDEEAAEMQTYLSRSEYRSITKRLKRGKNQTIEKGGYTSNPPYGYRQVYYGRTPSLAIVEEEEPFVKQIYQMYADGSGCTVIEQTINALGAHGRRGSRFNRNTIRTILDNPVYIGKIRWNKTTIVKKGIGPDAKRMVQYNSPDTWKVIDGQHPPIIEQALWDKVQARRKSRYLYVDNKHVANPMASLVTCATCGHKINMMGNSKKGIYMLCPTKGCTAGAKFEYVEQAVLDYLATTADKIALDLQTLAPPDTATLETNLSTAQAQLKKLDDRRNRLYALLEDETYTRAVFSQRMQALAQEEEATQQLITTLEHAITAELSKNKSKQLDQIKTVLAYYHTSTLAAKKDLLHSIIQRIEYTKHKKTKPADFHLSITLKTFI